MKKSVCLLSLMLGIFLAILISALSFVSAVECNADLSQGGNSCIVSSSLTLNGSYVVNMNGSIGGAIAISASNIILNCNNTQIYGNLTNNLVGIFINSITNVTIINCSLVNYNQGLKVQNANGTIINSIFINNSRGIEFQGGFANFTVTNSTFYNNTYAGIRFFSASILTNVNINNNNFNLYSAGIKGDLNSANISILSNIFNVLSSTSSPSIWGLIHSNWNVENNIVNGFGVIDSYGMSFRGNNTLSINNTIQHTQYSLNLQGANNFTSINDTFKNNDEGLSIEALTNGAYFYNTQIRNNTQNYDGYNVGGKIFNSSNILFSNPNITEIATVGLLFQSNYNISIINPNFDFIPLSQRSFYLSNDGYEPRCAIQSTMFYKGFYQTFGNYNLTISGATFDNDTTCYVQLENQTLFTSDLTNYYYRSFSYNNSINGLREFYIPKGQQLSNYLTFPNYVFRLGGGSGTGCSLGTCKYLNYSEYPSYSYYQNINQTSIFTLSKYNLTSALLITNGTGICNGSLSNLALNTGNINITLQPNDFCYVLDNFNLTEGVSRENSPLWFSSSSNTEKHIASNLTQNITTTVYVNVQSCRNLKGGNYVSDDGTQSSSYTAAYLKNRCSGNVVNLVLTIDPAVSSNVLSFTGEFDNAELVDICTNLEEGFTSFGSLLILIILAIVMVVVFSVIQESGLDWKFFFTGAVLVIVFAAIINIIGGIIIAYLC